MLGASVSCTRYTRAAIWRCSKYVPPCITRITNDESLRQGEGRLGEPIQWVRDQLGTIFNATGTRAKNTILCTWSASLFASEFLIVCLTSSGLCHLGRQSQDAIGAGNVLMPHTCSHTADIIPMTRRSAYGTAILKRCGVSGCSSSRTSGGRPRSVAGPRPMPPRMRVHHKSREFRPQWSKTTDLWVQGGKAGSTSSNSPSNSITEIREWTTGTSSTTRLGVCDPMPRVQSFLFRRLWDAHGMAPRICRH